MLAVAGWLVGNALEMGSVTLSTKIFWANVQYLGIVVVPVAWLAFAVQYAGRQTWLTRRNLLLLLILPTVTLVLVWTNPAHGLFRSAVSLDNSGSFPVLNPTRGPWFGIHTVYSYLLLLLGTALLVQKLIYSPPLYRRQVGALLIGVLAPWVGNVVFIAGLTPFPNGDPIPFTFTVGGLAIAWGLFRFRLLDLAPVARDALVEGMSDALIVLDERDRIVDLNPAARQIAGQGTIEPIGQPAGQVFPVPLIDLIASLDERKGPAEIALGKDPRRSFDIRGSPLYDRRGRYTGRLVVLRDITQRVEAEKALRKTRDELELRVEARTAELAGVNRQLRAEIDERGRVEQELREREEKYRNLFENSLNGFALHEIVANAEGEPIDYIFLDANRAFEELTGLRVDKVIGRRVTEVLPGVERDPFIEIYGRVALTGEPARFEQFATPLDRHFDIAAFSPRKGQFATIFTDITERQRAEEQVQRLANKLKAIALPARQMSSLLDPDQLVQQVVQSLQEITGCYNANFFLLEEDNLVLAAGRGGYANGDPPVGYRLATGKGIIGQVAQTGQPLLAPDVSKDLHYMAWEGLPHTRSELAVPVKSGDRLLGVMDMQATVPEAFDATDLEALGVLADQLAVALENARLYEDAQRRLRQVQALREVDRAIAASFDLRLTLKVCLEQVAAQLSVDATDVLLLNPKTQFLEYAAGRGFRTAALRHTHLRLGEGHAGRTALERRIVHVPDLTEAENGLGHSTPLADEQFITYYGVPLIGKGQVKGVLEVFHREPLDPDPEWLDFLDTLAGQVAIAIDNASLFEDLQHSNLELIRAYDTTLEGWARALELRDMETEGHSRRVTEMTLRLARAMRVSEEELAPVRRGALLHDIGKMGIPDSILLKPGWLTEEEREIMERHPVYAREMLAPIDFLRPALDIPYCHHEKWDGSGYPRGLKGEQIPLAARIFAVVDVYDALTSDRPYRHAWSEEETLEHIREQAGRHFDPQVVETFLELIATDGDS